ncbi:3-methyl-2-oxobutanoate hydroxymethyltransferase PanB [Gottschalkia purinilytica]|uniref:3-methyl-2-oxobutanoate hydroxymethyltransferase n=1 Tax=Gottschalkia purinilytica TaxID=1503 RepID=A0A0L0WC90_GOTPU|nr:3-methyl-2-oxobutanoate hydroxymethyltransferase [Gottschalkia purinilytica]KNF09025.1 3-methyl-2-oxobutanoate hydroxymethyltransferase PanB [Gottschalkia purinilytica]
METKFTVKSFLESKKKNQKITVLTAYDYQMAKLVDEAGIECILVGDSLGMVVLGHDSTLQVTIDDMIYHLKAVSKGSKNALIIGDMPFLSYHVSPKEAVKNAGRLVKEGFAQGVKLEGGVEIIDKVKAIIDAKIPVLGHIGLTPQSINMFGGFKIQGTSKSQAEKIIKDSISLEEAGVFGIVLEGIPKDLADLITRKLNIPTIGIGAGSGCDGQVLVINDMLGMNTDFTPKFVKRYANLKDDIKNSVRRYIEEVKNKEFPSEEHTFSVDNRILEKLY